MIKVTVKDRGPGVAPAERRRLVLPFERGEASRNRATGGVGLGLSLVDEFARGQGGALRKAYPFEATLPRKGRLSRVRRLKRHPSGSQLRRLGDKEGPWPRSRAT